jgi:hypothetical protein
MSARLTVLALAILIVGAVYSTVNDANAVDARTVLVCPTPTPHPTPAGPPTGTPIPTTGLSRPIPAFPMVYFGDVTVGGNPVPDCTGIYAKVEEFESGRVIVVDGKYAGLALGAPDASYNKAVITFHLADALVADQTDTYVYTQAPSISMIKQGFNLNFPHLVTPEPTITPKPTNTPIPTNTPLPSFTPTPTPIPTNTAAPVNTPTPVVAGPAVYSGPLVVAGGVVPSGAVLIARVGSYESLPALIKGQSYQNLVVAPDNVNFIGQRIEFFLNGFGSATTETYIGGSFENSFALTFVGFPTPNPTPTNIPTVVVPTSTPPPTSTPTPAHTPSSVPTISPTPSPAHTPSSVPTISPTPSPEPTAILRPTRTPLPTLVPTKTPAPSATASLGSLPSQTATPAPTATPEPSGGFCSSNSDVPLAAGIGNLLMLLAPVGLVYGARRFRRHGLL